jgi:hypothetical protein
MYAFDWHELLIGRVGHIWAAILAFLSVFSLMLLINFVLAPAKLQEEADREIASLSKKLNDREARQAAIDELWRLRAEGISHRNCDAVHGTSTAVAYASWKADYENWRHETLTVARAVNVNLHNWLDRLDRTVPSPGGQTYFNPEHELLTRIMSTMLDRMQRYLEKEL